MAAPRRDTRGIVDAAGLMARVRFRRHEPAPELRPFLEHYWFIDWDLTEPYASHVVPHPSVNIVFQRQNDEPGFGEVAGIGRGLFTRKLEGVGRVCGVQFKPGGFGPFAPGRPVSEWTGRRLPLTDVFPALTDGRPGTALTPGRPGTALTPDPPCPVPAPADDPPAVVPAPADDPPATVPAPARDPAVTVLAPDGDPDRVAALDAFLLSLGPQPDPRAALAMALADRIRRDRTVRRAGDLARSEALSLRSLQRLFARQVGVGPKWVILRYRIHEALEHAESEAAVDWAGLAADLGYTDQAHLIRDFTATVGVPPTAYAPGR